MTRLYLLLAFLLTLASCADRRLNAGKQTKQQEMAELYAMMCGEFSSAEQAKADSSFYDINLVMHPIWKDHKEAKWLYVEQAVTEYLKKPYRQRVYKISLAADGRIESRVYELPNPAKFVHGWENPSLFQQINPDSLVLRQGCAVFLQKTDDCYAGSTNEKDCKSTLRGATYATSKVSVCKDQVVSWDQGWNDEDQQVWGAEIRGYVFKRKGN
ncbi:MAG: chromophore lyase CpcT/CpeT [Bacteroidota bacterium]